MSFVVEGKITADGSAAKAAIRDVQTETQKLVNSSTGVTKSNKSAAESAAVFAAGIREQEEALAALNDRLTPAVRKSEEYLKVQQQLQTAVGLGLLGQGDADRMLRSAERALGGIGDAADHMGQKVGNSSHQFKMIAYQLNQIGQMGAVTKDWTTAIAIQLPDIMASFGGLPMVLAGGAIAVGFSLLPALMQTGDATEALSDNIDHLSERLDALRSSTTLARGSLSELTDRFGSNAEQARAVLEIQRQLVELDAMDAFDAAIGSAGSSFGSASIEGVSDFSEALGRYRELKAEYDATLAEMDQMAAGGSYSSPAAVGLNSRLMRINDEIQGLGDVERQLEALARTYGVTADQAAELVAAAEAIEEADGITAQTKAAQGLLEKLKEYTGGVFGGTEDAREMVRLLSQAVESGLELESLDLALLGGDGAEMTAAQARAARELVDQYREQATIAEAVLRYGAESLTVMGLQRDAHLASVDAMIAEAGYAEDVANEIRDAAMAAYDAERGIRDGELAALGLANAIGAISFANPLAGAEELQGRVNGLIQQASRLMGIMGRAGQSQVSADQNRDLLQTERDMLAAGRSRVEIEGELAAQRARYNYSALETVDTWGVGSFVLDVVASQARTTAEETAQLNEEIAKLNEPAASGGSGGSGGSRSPLSKTEAEADRAREAVAKLIETLRDEIEVMGEADPVQQEMIRYRETLAAATQAEREQVEQLIIQRNHETAVMDQLSYVSQETGNAMIDSLMGAKNAGDALVDTLLRAVLQAAILGNGPFGGLFGGGIFGTIFPGLTFADGGMIYGEGGPRDDKVPTWTSPGEFIVNAKSTRRHRALLEQINSAPGYANGGLIGGGASAGAASGSATAAPNIYIDARGSNDPAETEAAARRGMQSALDEYRRSGLPADVREINANPNVLRGF